MAVPASANYSFFLRFSVGTESILRKTTNNIPRASAHVPLSLSVCVQEEESESDLEIEDEPAWDVWFRAKLYALVTHER